MAATQLSLYNGALRLLGQRKLASLSEDRAPRHYLDDVWDDGAIQYCLEQGQWTFATRTVQLDYTPSVTPPFGCKYAFVKPDDYVRTTALCEDEFFRFPIVNTPDEAGYWYANVQTIYIKYVSNDSSYGLDLSRWPETFKHFIHVYLAKEIMHILTSVPAQKVKEVAEEWTRVKRDAMSKDALNKGVQTSTPSNWTMSRMGNRTSQAYRGENF